MREPTRYTNDRPDGDDETVLAEVRRKIAVGIEQARRGEFLDGDAVFDELLADLPPDDNGS